MKLYENLYVETAFQNCGSSWLLILCGSEEQIELTYNGLYNLGATNARRFATYPCTKEGLEYVNSEKTCALMWTKPEYMYRFFFNRHSLATGASDEQSKVIASMRMEEFRQVSEQFHDFNKKGPDVVYSIGKSSAERPDDNYKENAIFYFQKKSGEVTVDN